MIVRSLGSTNPPPDQRAGQNSRDVSVLESIISLCNEVPGYPELALYYLGQIREVAAIRRRELLNNQKQEEGE